MPADEGPTEVAGQQIVRGRIAGLVKGGFEVETDRGPGFCSLSQIDARRVTDASSFLHREFDFATLGLAPLLPFGPRHLDSFVDDFDEIDGSVGNVLANPCVVLNALDHLTAL